MLFALISKKGNKTNVKQIEVPLDSYLASKTKERQQLEEKEREQVKEQIMKMTAHAGVESTNHNTNEEDES